MCSSRSSKFGISQWAEKLRGCMTERGIYRSCSRTQPGVTLDPADLNGGKNSRKQRYQFHVCFEAVL